MHNSPSLPFATIYLEGFIPLPTRAKRECVILTKAWTFKDGCLAMNLRGPEFFPRASLSCISYPDLGLVTVGTEQTMLLRLWNKEIKLRCQHFYHLC